MTDSNLLMDGLELYKYLIDLGIPESNLSPWVPKMVLNIEREALKIYMCPN